MVTGILLVNLGTPRSPHSADVHRYLVEFLTDPRVIDLPWLKRQWLVRTVIVPARVRQSTQAYRAIWSPNGSPLMVYGTRVRDLLQQELGKLFHVELAMRYQEPSIASGIHHLLQKKVEHLIVLPLFPQYASATTGSVHQRVMEVLSEATVIPKVTLISHYATDPHLIDAFCAVAKEYPLEDYDHFLFSFHGLPEKQVKSVHSHCLNVSSCCEEISSLPYCYSAQCHAGMKAIASQLGISPERYSICFQSRLGKDPWLQPYASEVIARLAKEGKKQLLVISPSFVCDCLETTFEIGKEYRDEFLHAGGERLDLVRGLNDHPLWIKALKRWIQAQARD